MLPLPDRSLDREQRRLLDCFKQLDGQGRESLLAFGEFLVSRRVEGPEESARPLEPRDIPRPTDESVVAAIRRLSETYYMLERKELLHDTAGLMSAHVMQGRPAAEVVDELEALFEERYRHYLTHWNA